jgi:hypothetical protein
MKCIYSVLRMGMWGILQLLRCCAAYKNFPSGVWVALAERVGWSNIRKLPLKGHRSKVEFSGIPMSGDDHEKITIH